MTERLGKMLRYIGKAGDVYMNGKPLQPGDVIGDPDHVDHFQARADFEDACEVPFEASVVLKSFEQEVGAVPSDFDDVDLEQEGED